MPSVSETYCNLTSEDAITTIGSGEIRRSLYYDSVW